MTVAQCVAKYRSGPVNAARVLDSAVLPLYGSILREAAITNNNNSFELNSRIKHIAGAPYYMVHAAGQPIRFYKGYNGATKILLAADPTILPLAGETITQGGTTGTCAEDYIAGDNYVVVLGETNGPFVAGAVSFSGGGTATINSAEDNGGEFALDFEGSLNPQTEVSVSGLHYARMPSGAAGLAMTFISLAGANQVTITFDPTLTPGSEWSEVTRGAGGSIFGAAGTSVIHNNILYWNYRLSSSTIRAFLFFNPETDVAGFFTVPLSREMGVGLAICRGRLFAIGRSSASSSTLRLLELVGGGSVTRDDVASAGVGADSWLLSGSIQPYLFRGEDDNALYAVESLGTLAGVNRQVVRWVVPAAGALTRTCPIDGGQSQIDIGEAILPLDRREDSVNTNDLWRTYRDIETTPGSPILNHYWFQSFSVAAVQYIWAGWSDLVSGNPVTWDGTTTVQFPSPHGLSVGDWIRHNDTNLSFRVSGTPSTTEATIDDSIAIDQGFAIPSAASATSQMQEMAAVAPTGLIIAYDMSDDGKGGGDSTFTPGEKHPDMISPPADVVGGERQEWLGYEGTGPCRATGWFMRADGSVQQMNLANADQGGPLTIIGNEIQGVTADGVTPFEVTWLSEGQGIVPGEIVDRWLRIFV